MPDAAPLESALLRRLRFSAATAAFQVEGARRADGRDRSIWDDFVETPDRVRDGSTAEPGPDSYHRFYEDVALLAGLGVDQYRFSISWVRVLADGAPNLRGIAYYDRLVDALLGAGVTPAPTLYHWDLPSALEAEGGWLNRATAEHFAEYVEVVAAALGDRVRHWYTINEPVSTTLQGYAIGELAPGRTLLFDSLPTVHHQLLAHGLAVPILRAHGAERIGIVNNHTQVLPASADPADQQAAYLYDLIHNRVFADPVLLGRYPDLEPLGVTMPVHDGDLALISAPCEVYGVNYYNPTTVAACEGPVPFEVVPTPGAPTTGFGPLWPIVPEALTAFLVDAHERYGAALPPIAIAENGASFPEPAHTEERLDDDARISYLRGHVAAVREAIRAGVRVDEYTVWSLLDNFEWAEGFTQRFGLVHVDMDTGRRTPKASYSWYRALIEEARA
ncbi:GH1 family beta-glucosidase [Microbacterium panaciterrae]|uniref:Beta-glucosidase n=1 Tax=Microbacterium panaciterrae TaxID=985759 RepID=A0ABP8PC98_9MICO